MPCLSRPFNMLVQKGGEIIWKETSALKFPKNRKRIPIKGLIALVGFVHVAVVVIFYCEMQSEFNPNSWYAKAWKPVQDIISGSFHVNILPQDFLPGDSSNQPETENAVEEDERVKTAERKRKEKLIKRLGFF